MILTRYHIYKRLFLPILFLFAASVYSQIYNFRNYGVKDGLQESQITSIVQGEDGYLWVGTQGGLSRFDGLTFTNFNRFDGLTGVLVNTICNDGRGNLLIGYANGTITGYNYSEQKFFAEENITERLAGKSVRSILRDPDGNIWVQADYLGVILHKKDGKIVKLDKSHGLKNTVLGRLFLDSEGNVHAGFRQTIVNFKITEDSVQTESPGLEKFLPADAYITDVIVHKKNKFFIGTNNGFFLFDKAKNSLKKIKLPDAEKNAAIIDLEINKEGLWIATQYFGLFFIPSASLENKVERYTVREGLYSNDLLTLFTDSESNLWVGTDGFGLIQIRDRQFRFYSKKTGLAENQIWSVFQDSKGRFWIGSSGGVTLTRKHNHNLLLKNSKFFRKAYKGRKFYLVVKFFEDSEGNVWTADFIQGAMRYDERKKRIVPAKNFIKDFPDYAVAIAEDDRKNLWFGTVTYGVYKYNMKTRELDKFTVKKDGILSDSVTAVVWDGEALWFCGHGGIFSYKDGKFHNYPAVTKGKKISFFDIKIDSDKNIWLLSDDLMLYKFQQDTFINYSFRKELKNLVNYTFWPENDTLIWLGTQMGIVRYDPRRQMSHMYGIHTGYQISEANQYAAYKDAEGDLWIGTINGLVQYIPGKEKINPFPPKLLLTGIRVFMGETFRPPLNPKFPHDHNFLTFEYVGISFSDPQNVRYQVKLEGFDPDWLPGTPDHTMTYSNLPPGEYIFKVRAANSDGVWTPEPLTYAFVINPPFWLTTWFILSSIFFVIGMTVFSFKRHLNKIKKNQLLLEKRVKERTKELLQEKEKVEKINVALKQSETKFRAYTESASSAIMIYDEKRFLYGNPAMEEITGYSLDELIGMAFLDIVHPDDKEIIRQRAKQRLSGETPPERYEFRIIRKDGEVRWMLFTARRIEYEGKPAGLATAFDITDLILAETRLKEEKQLLDVTLRSIQEAIITIDREGKVVLLNDQAKKILEIEEDGNKSVFGESVSDILILEDMDGKKTVIEMEELESLDSHSVTDLRAYYRRKDGERIILSYGIAPIISEENNITGWVIALRDITDMQRLEEELLKTQKLESIGVLAGGIAHDFNNILTAILGNISLVKLLAKENSEIYEQIEIAEKATFRARDLTQQLLTFSKGGMPVLKTTKLRDLIIDSAQFVMRGADSRCEFDIASDLVHGNVDPGQISQVLQNLILNAKQALPEGGIIKIKAFNEYVSEDSALPLSPGQYIKIVISDNGKGIPEEVREKIFDPFFTTKPEGNGLGLSTAYYIIQKHKGYITFESEVNVGTTFEIYLPASDKKEYESDEVDVKDVRFEGKILVMDDEKSVREVLSAMLKHIGFDVYAVEDGEKVVAEYKKSYKNGEPYHAVILDLTIPGGMGGKAAIKKILEFDSAAKVIVASGYSNDVVLANYSDYGFVARLHKPFDIKELSNVLQMVCKNVKPQ